jgi:hypothetical protein
MRWRVASGAWDSTRVNVDAEGRATVAIPVAPPTMTLLATDGRGASDTVLVAVGAAAAVRDIALEARFPASTGRAAEAIALGTPNPLPRGTTVRVSARLIGALSGVGLSTNGDTAWLSPDADGVARGSVPVVRSAEWRWVVQGRDAALVDLPASLVVDVGSDAAPVARILAPGGDTLVTPGDVVPMLFAASDDHAITRVSVVVRRDGDRTGARTVRYPLAADVGGEWTSAWSLPLERLSLEPGESVVLTLVAEDDAADRQRGESAPVRLRVPELSEQRSLSRAAGEALAQRAQALAASQRQLERRTQDAARAAKAAAAGGEKAMSYDAAEKAKGIAQAQRQASEQVRKMAEEARRLEQQLKGANALDSALAQQLRDAQQLMREAMSPDLQQQLASLERSAQSLDQQQARQSMEQLAEQQRAMREQLERSAEMLKRAALEGALATLRDEAKDVAKAQREKAEGASAPSPRENAQQLSERARKVAQESRALADRLEQAGAKAGAAKARAADPKALASAEKMQQVAKREQPQSAADAARQGAPSRPQSGEKAQAGEKASPDQKDAAQRNAADAAAAAQSMEEAAQQLADARDAQIGQWKNEVGQQLDQAIQELSQLQRAQQQLEQQMKQGGDAQQMQAQQNAVQQGVEKVAQRMEQAGKASSLVSQRTQKAMNDARQQAQRAKEAMANGQQGGDPQPGSDGQGQPQQGKGKDGAREALEDAANALSDAAASMVRDRERLNGAQSASGFSDMIEQMKELAQQQGALNGQLAQMGMNPGGGANKQEGLGVDPNAREKAAQQQRQIARALEDVADADATGKADALAKEARALASSLERGAPDPAVLARQQQLYKRMLSAGQFLEQEEQDESGKREATPYRGGTPFVPAAQRVDAKPLEPFAAPGWESLRTLSAEERRLVGEYFKRLNAKP